MYKSDDYVRSELLVCQELMKEKETDLKKLLDLLAFIYVHCSEEISETVYDHMIEVEIRMYYNELLDGVKND